MERFELKRGGVVVSWGLKQDLTVSCVNGEVWVTQAGDAQDHIIRPNGHFTCGAHQAVVIQALQSAEIEIEGGSRSHLSYAGDGTAKTAVA